MNRFKNSNKTSCPTDRRNEIDQPLPASKQTDNTNMVHFLLSIVVCSIALLSVAFADLVAMPFGKPLALRELSGNTASIFITSGGIQRDYLLFVPASYTGSSPVPLIFSFHGRGKDAVYQQKLSQFSDTAYNKNAIVAYPNGVAVSLDGLYSVDGRLMISYRTPKAQGNFKEIRIHRPA
jgi:hypothetical protein